MSFGTMMIDVVSRAIEHDVDQEDFTEFAAAIADDAEKFPVETFAEPIPAEPLQIPVELEKAVPNEPCPPRAKFTASRKELSDALKLAESGSFRKCLKPALQSVRLSVNGTVRLDSTNLESTVRIDQEEWERSGEAEILIDPKRLAAALKLSKAPSVDVIVSESELIIGPSTIPAAADLDQFPACGWEFPADDEIRASFYVDAQRFAAAVKRTEISVDAESTRYALGGIMLEADQDGARLVSTDSRRLSLCEMGAPAGFGATDDKGESIVGVSYVVPLATMLRLSKAIGKRTGDVRIIAHNSRPIWNDTPVQRNDVDGKPIPGKVPPVAPGKCDRLTFIVETSNGRQTFSTQLVQGRFPDWRRVIPADCRAEHVFNVGDLLQTVKIAQSVGTEESRCADFEFFQDTCKISASSFEGGKMSDHVRSSTIQNWADGPIKATFDPRYIAEFLDVLPDSEAVGWKLIDKDSAAVLHAEDRLTYVIMPLFRDA